MDGSFVEANASKGSRIPREQLAEAAQVNPRFPMNRRKRKSPCKVRMICIERPESDSHPNRSSCRKN